MARTPKMATAPLFLRGTLSWEQGNFFQVTEKKNNALGGLYSTLGLFPSHSSPHLDSGRNWGLIPASAEVELRFGLSSRYPSVKGGSDLCHQRKHPEGREARYVRYSAGATSGVG